MHKPRGHTEWNPRPSEQGVSLGQVLRPLDHVCEDRHWNGGPARHVNVNVSNLLAMSELDFVNSGEPGPQAEGVNHLETALRQLHVTHRASSCA